MLTKLAAVAWWLLALAYLGLLGLSLHEWRSAPHIGVDAVTNIDGRLTIAALRPSGLVWNAGAVVGDLLLEVDGSEIDEKTWALRGDAGTRFWWTGLPIPR